VAACLFKEAAASAEVKPNGTAPVGENRAQASVSGPQKSDELDRQSALSKHWDRAATRIFPKFE